MKRFLCICAAPAIDATVRLNAWPTDGCVIKNAADTFAVGGKTINVARWLALRGASVTCAGVLGEDNAVLFEKEFRRYGIEDRMVRVKGSTRVNEMFVTPSGSFKVNRAADFGQLEELGGIEKLVDMKGFEMVIISGSLPKGWPVETYRELVERAKATGARVVLDASGAALREGVKAKPQVIKPNAEECEALIGMVPKTREEFLKATAQLKEWAEYPIISDGGAGCWFNGELVEAPEVEVLDTTAAGDTLLAEWCFSGNPRRAVAAGSAACTMNGGTPPALQLVDKLTESIS